MTDEIIEHIGDDGFGVTVIYTLNEYRHVSIQFFATEINALSVPENQRLYTRAGADISCDHVTDPHDGECYVSGYVKWDGCSDVTFGHGNGGLHLCGWEHFDKLAQTMRAIYERCGELMVAHGGTPLEDEFRATSSVRAGD